MNKKFLVYLKGDHSFYDFDFDYDFLKPLNNQIDILNKIYLTIDDIIKKHPENEKSSLRELIIGDFFFSMTSLDLSNIQNTIFRMSRNEYIQKITFRAKINNLFGYDKDQYIIYHKKLLIGLRHDNVIIRTIVKTQSKDSSSTWETLILNDLILEKPLDWKVLPLGVSNKPFLTLKFEKDTYWVSSFRNIWKIKRKKTEMNWFKTPDRGVIRSTTIPLVLSKKLYDINKKHIDSEEKSLLQKSNSSNMDEYFKTMRALLEDNAYAYVMMQDYHNGADYQWNSLWGLKNSINFEIRRKYKIFQKLISISLTKRDIFNKKMYIPCFIDNRSRQYHGTLLSPTFYHIFRHLYEFHEHVRFNKLEESMFYKKIIKFKHLIPINFKNNHNAYIYIILSIEIGKYFIKNKKCYTKTDEIIEIGIHNFEKRTELKNLEDRMYLEKIYNTLDDLVNNKHINDNTVLYKDATASGLQNYGIILGYKKDMLKFINLDGDGWCDTYLYIVNKFLKTNDNRFNNRKYWKSTIMTIPYNASWSTCFKRFLKELQSDGINYLELSDDERESIKKMHLDFYNNIKENVKDLFFENKTGPVKLFTYSKKESEEVTEYKINYRGDRDKYVKTTIVWVDDLSTSKKASEANNMHYLDAALVRHVLAKYDIIPVHDCFGIRLCELHNVMDLINDYYSKKIKECTYSIFVII